MGRQNWSAQHRISLISTLAFALVAVVAVAGINLMMRRAALAEAEEKARILLQHNLSIHAYINEQQKPHLMELVEDQIAQGYFEPSWMSSTFVIRHIDTEYRHLSKQRYYYKEAAINARSPENEADPFERAFIEELNQNPQLTQRTEIRRFNEEPHFVVMHRGEVMEPACLRCHSDPAAAPEGLVEYYGPHRSFGRELGEVVSAVSIRIPLAQAYGEANRVSFQLSAVLLVLLGGLYLLQRRLIAKYWAGPLGRLQERFVLIADSPKRLGEQVELNAGAEFQAVLEGFNRLSAQLATTQDHLEKGNRRLFRQMEELEGAQQDLARSNRKFEDLVANVPGVVFQFEQDGLERVHLLYLSRRVEEFFGISPQAALAEPERLVHFVPVEDRVRVRREFERALEQNRLLRTQFKVEPPGLAARWLEGQVRPGEEGRHLKLFNGLLVDVTEQKELEERLVAAEEAAQTQAQAKGRFLATMSHEVKTPMNAILGYAELLDLEVAEEPLRGYIRAIQSSGRSLERLLDDILNLSQAEAGHLTLHPQPTHLGRLAREACEQFQPEADRKGLQLLLDLDPALQGWFRLDPARLQQVLGNLLGNAVKFTDQGQVRLELKPETPGPVSADSAWLAVVSDTGMGISAKEMPHIFEPFAHHEEPGRVFKGTGLGLSICRMLVRLMGGTIEAESQLGQGSRFTVRFPALPPAEAPEAPLELESEERPRFAPAKVLVVDDMEINRLLLAEYLKGTGLEVLEAGDGQQAVELARAERPQVVLMDLKMPRLGGVEATAQIKALPETAALKVVALSAEAPEEEEYARLGFDACLLKPIDSAQLYRTLARFLMPA